MRVGIALDLPPIFRKHLSDDRLRKLSPLPPSAGCRVTRVCCMTRALGCNAWEGKRRSNRMVKGKKAQRESRGRSDKYPPKTLLFCQSVSLFSPCSPSVNTRNSLG